MKFTNSDTDATTDIPAGIVQALTFMDDGDVFLMYTAGDCDVFLPYNLLPNPSIHNDGRPITEACEHPGLFANYAPTEHCFLCGRDVPIAEL